MGPLPPGFTFCPSEHDLITRYLLPMIAGEVTDELAEVAPFIYEEDAYGSVPEDLVADRQHTVDGNKNKAWYFVFPPRYKSAGCRKRLREVGDAADGLCWHEEKGKTVHGADGQIVGRVHTFSIVAKDKKSCVTRLGWCMVEYSSVAGGGRDLVLCKVYRSTRTGTAALDSEASASDSASAPSKKRTASSSSSSSAKKRKADDLQPPVPQASGDNDQLTGVEAEPCSFDDIFLDFDGLCRDLCTQNVDDLFGTYPSAPASERDDHHVAYEVLKSGDTMAMPILIDDDDHKAAPPPCVILAAEAEVAVAGLVQTTTTDVPCSNEDHTSVSAVPMDAEELDFDFDLSSLLENDQAGAPPCATAVESERNAATGLLTADLPCQNDKPAPVVFPPCPNFFEEVLGRAGTTSCSPGLRMQPALHLTIF